MLLDPQAVEEALARLQDAKTKRTTARPMSGDALIAIANVKRELAGNRREFEGESGIDLVTVGLRAIRSLPGR